MSKEEPGFADIEEYDLTKGLPEYLGAPKGTPTWLLGMPYHHGGAARWVSDRGDLGRGSGPIYGAIEQAANEFRSAMDEYLTKKEPDDGR